MFRAFSLGKKVIKKRQEQKYIEGYLQRVNDVRPSTTNHGEHRLLNNGKKMMLMENKYTEIERQNRLLLEKIVAKKQKKVDQRQKMNKSLNSNFRKRQLQNIQIENARLLKRLQDRKSDYQTYKFQKDWKKQKLVIKNISNYPYIIRDMGGTSPSRKGKRRTFSKQLQRTNMNEQHSWQENIQISRLCNLQGVNITVAIKLNQQKLTIVGDLGHGKDLKIINIPREQSLQFIEEQCDGKFQQLFNHLYFDKQEQALYLISKDSQFDKLQRLDQVTQNQ